MATNYAVRVDLPGAQATTIAVATAASTYTSLGTPHPARIWAKSSVDTYVRGYGATETGPVTAGVSMYLSAGVDYVFDLPAGITRVRVKNVSSNGTFRFVRAA